ncbi:Cyclin, N-terminal domain containing protein [Trichomonas vaginalis G3]|uniref:Cyclin, N-terminal domain containing protein n=1 Tax=Trichomonas vaginalis (strain ATCC PRA-98 / G3) TaxID=412133 RepID=A2FC68_TRIV3|nr:cell division [Trichomonas vaginalis G3]EAX97481.1 Cyclin, N-terminal domain containing protein [Trichomonas vaginalis G3]KAI5547050.1 cell division [Trichomonas vaginalis G3]|eukprot:XP_001310411.1 Cyclin, N-terminal domain containing protein [Trichomonas vaginalis G3]
MSIFTNIKRLDPKIKQLGMISNTNADMSSNNQNININENIKAEKIITISSSQERFDDEYSDPDIYSDESEEDSNDLFQKLDQENLDKPLQLASSASAIFAQAYEDEQTIPISKQSILKIQTALTPKYREVTVRWLIQLNYHFKLTSDTLYSAVTYFDIYISLRNIELNELQLYAVVCYWISAKIDNRCQPPIAEFNKITNENFTLEQFSRAEVNIVTALNFTLNFPTSKFFMRRFLLLTRNDSNLIEITNFFTEIALQKWEFIEIPPSLCAISAIACAASALGYSQDAKSVIHLARYNDYELLLNCAQTMLKIGKETTIKQKERGKEIAMFSSLDFDVDISKNF